MFHDTPSTVDPVIHNIQYIAHDRYYPIHNAARTATRRVTKNFCERENKMSIFVRLIVSSIIYVKFEL